MKYHLLIAQSEANLNLNPIRIVGVISTDVFSLGAKWMFDRLNENEAEVKFDKSINFAAYGFLKYGVSFFVGSFAAFLLGNVNLFLLPLSIVAFYLAEVHFLFLFPILIDKVKSPIWTSIRQTYKMGLLTTLVTVIPIGFYMVFGLLNFKDPFRNWYVGCLAILYWYKDEIRNRI
jgi:hypothetical protein